MDLLLAFRREISCLQVGDVVGRGWGSCGGLMVSLLDSRLGALISRPGHSHYGSCVLGQDM